MVLLDLLGARNPQFLNYFNRTERLYEHLVYTESRLLSLGSLEQPEQKYNKQNPAYFHPYSNPLFYTIRIEDDHLPFLHRNVRRNCYCYFMQIADEILCKFQKKKIFLKKMPIFRFLIQVPILHLIPHRFPEVWHTPQDNYDVIHFPTVANLDKILGIFCLEYLLL